MSSVKDKNIVSEAMLDMENIKKAIKEESKQTIATLLNETVKNSIREAIEDDDKKEEKATKKEEEKQDGTPVAEPEKDGEEDESEEVVDIDDENEDEKPEEDDDFAEYSEYKVDDNTYDLSGEKDNDKVVSVYKKLSDDDVVVTVDDCKVNLKDNETGAEYVLDLGDECQNEPEEEINEELLTGGDEDFELDTDEDDDEESEHEEFDDTDDINLDDELSDLDGEDSEEESEFEIEDDDEPAGIPDLNEGRKSMQRNNERIFEVDLGYTDNYQSKDVIDGLSMEEPSKSGRNWDKGLPTVSKKPWAGSTKGKGMPFTQNVNECGTVPPVEDGLEEGTNVTLPNSRKKVKSHTPDTEKKNYPKNAHHDSVAGEYYAERMNEAIKLNKAYKKEIADLKEAVSQLKNCLNETYLTNVNLGQITRLFVENTTTRAEKQDIISRFDNVKSTKDAKKLYESVSKELKAKSPKNPVMENTVKATKAAEDNSAKKQVMNESLSKIHDFMNRIALY